MRVITALVAVLALSAVGCGSDGDSDDTAVTDAPAATEDAADDAEGETSDGTEPADETETTEAGTATEEPTSDTAHVAVVDELQQAEADGDAAAWAAHFADDAVFVMIGGDTIEMWAAAPGGTDDFDGDGVNSFADVQQAEVALGPPSVTTMEWECTAVDETDVECEVVREDEFMRIAFPEREEAPPVTIRYTVVDGRVVEWEVYARTDLETHQEAAAALFTTWTAYEQWVVDSRPELHGEMYHGECCTAMMVMTPEGVALHTELMPEYFASLEA